MRLQVQKFWDVKATVIPIVVGALGIVSKELENDLKTIGIPIAIYCLQKASLLGTAFILAGSLAFQRVGKSQISKHFSRHVVVMLYHNNNDNNNNNNNNDNNNNENPKPQSKRTLNNLGANSRHLSVTKYLIYITA